MKSKSNNTKKTSFGSKLINCILLSIVLILKKVNFPTQKLPRRIRKIADNWTNNMLSAYITSFGSKVYIDEDCTYDKVIDTPKCEVENKYRLSSEQIKDFHKDGFIGPLTAMSEEDMAVFRKSIEDELELESKTFGKKTVRDRHLDAPFILNMFKNPAITESLAQLLGPDILIWRSQVFNQIAGAAPIAWHQASTYMVEDYKVAALKPQDKNDLFQLTVWIAIDDANLENGCIQFLKGTHDRIRTIKLGTKDKFFKKHFTMDLDLEKEEKVAMPLRPGQFVIFSERCIHGNDGNKTNGRRMGINFRAITPTTIVNKDRKKYYAVHFEKSWDLSKWGVTLLRGKDDLKLNKYPPTEEIINTQEEIVENAV